MLPISPQYPGAVHLIGIADTDDRHQPKRVIDINRNG
jgi:hypothetical protein